MLKFSPIIQACASIPLATARGSVSSLTWLIKACAKVISYSTVTDFAKFLG